jgi:hypothetical protein
VPRDHQDRQVGPGRLVFDEPLERSLHTGGQRLLGNHHGTHAMLQLEVKLTLRFERLALEPRPGKKLARQLPIPSGSEDEDA